LLRHHIRDSATHLFATRVNTYPEPINEEAGLHEPPL